MHIAFAILIGLHGLVHLLGVVKAFGWAEVAELRQPIPPPMGLLWLAAAVLLVLGGVLWGTRSSAAWLVTLAGVVLSQILIFTVWSDARAGTLANLLILVPLLLGSGGLRPGSLPARYRAEAAALRSDTGSDSGGSAWPRVTAEELTRLPEPVARWLEGVGVVDRPRVSGFRVRFDAAIRDAGDDPYMNGRAEQTSSLHPPRRLFLMGVRRGGLPVDVYHAYGPEGATMEARLLGLVPVVRAGGEEMGRSETVTFLNDLALLAPAALLDLDLEWTPRSPRHVDVAWNPGGRPVTAELVFDDAGTLRDFRSRDRLRSTGNGFEPALWRTPILSRHPTPGGLVLPWEAEAWWDTGAERWCYARFVIRSVETWS